MRRSSLEMTSLGALLVFYADENLIESLGEGVEEFTYTPVVSSGRPQNYAVVGQPLGVMKAQVIERDDAGNALIDDDGFYVETTDPFLVGDPNPDWTASLTNNLRYKDFTLGFTWQYRHGGDLFSQDAATLVGRGVLNPGTNREGLYVLDGFLSRQAFQTRRKLPLSTTDSTSSRLVLENCRFLTEQPFV